MCIRDRYWVVQMFSNNRGQQVVGSRLTGAAAVKQVVTKTVQNGRTTLFVKIVNPTGQMQSARLTFQGVSTIDGTGTLTVLSGSPTARNTLAAPDTVAPAVRQITGLALSNHLAVPANSVIVLRVTGR